MIPFGMMTATTDHGGTVMATQQQAIANGMAFLRAGDGFVCPKCKVWSTLIMSNQNIIMFGKPVAFAGDKFTCGATLMPSQSLVGGDKQSGGSAHSSQATTPQIYDHQFILKDTAGNVMANFAYTMQLPSGEIMHCMTDSAGKTLRHVTDGAQNLEIHAGHLEKSI